jgi:hypothetical protein
MAITVRQQPANLFPAYNDAVYILTSTNVGQTNFKFVVDIYVGGVKVDRMLIPPHPTELSGKVNVSPLLESRVSVDINLSDNRILPNTNSYVEYTLKIGEAYGTSGTVIYPGLATVSGKYLWNAVLDYPDFCNYSSGDYILSPSTPCDFLTHKPSSGDIMIDDNAWLYFNDFNLQLNYLYIVTRDSTGMTLNTFKVDNKYTSSRFLRCVSGCANLNTIPNAQFTLGSQPVIDGTEYDYTIQLFNSSNVAISERYCYTIVSNCSRYEKRRLQFLNELGGYDTFNFTLVSKETMDIERSMFKKDLGSYGASYSFVNSPNDRAYSQYHTRIKDKVSIQSDWVTEEQLAWLEQLVTSPDVRLDDGIYLIPINITNTSFEKKKVVNEKLFNLQLEYTLSYDRYRQRL